MKISHVKLSPSSPQFKESYLFETQTILLMTLQDFSVEKTFLGLPKNIQQRFKIEAQRLPEELSAGSFLKIQGKEKKEMDLHLALLPQKSDTFYLLEFARDLLKRLVFTQTKELRIIALGSCGLDPQIEPRLASAFGSALAIRINPIDVYGKRKSKVKKFEIQKASFESFCGPEAKSAFEEGFIAGLGTHMVRNLGSIPSNFLSPVEYGQFIKKTAKEYGFKLKFYTNKELKKMGAGGFTAVDQANPDSKGGIYFLHHKPAKKASKCIALVGKGMCFDTGGYDVKTNGFMVSMKGDMQGSAVALATMVSMAKLGLPIEVKAFLAVTENHISPKGYKPDDVVTALNGMTIEVINTDAEGRMVLSDTLTLASREKPDMIIDFATLTGGAIRAIGKKFGVVFSNRENLHEMIKSAGQFSGERVWTFPIDDTYFKMLESSVADISQCYKGSGPDHINAACFLSKFIENDIPWVHLDLSPSENEGGLGHSDSTFTGFGVRWALEFIKRA